MTAGTSALLITLGGGVAGIAALTRDAPAERIVTAVGEAAGTGVGGPGASGPGTGGSGTSGTDADGTDADGTGTGLDATAPVPPDAGAHPAVPGPASAANLSGAGIAPAAPHGAKTDVAAAAPRLAKPADRTATRNPRSAQAPTPSRDEAPASATSTDAPPALTTRTEVETREIPFSTRLIRDPSLPRGSQRVEAEGVPGLETLRYLVTLANGRPTDRRLVDAEVTRRPQHRVIALGGGRPHGRGTECGSALHLCVPLGHAAECAGKTTQDGADAKDGKQESALLLDGSAVVLDENVDLLDLDSIKGLTCKTTSAPED